MHYRAPKGTRFFLSMQLCNSMPQNLPLLSTAAIFGSIFATCSDVDAISSLLQCLVSGKLYFFGEDLLCFSTFMYFLACFACLLVSVCALVRFSARQVATKGAKQEASEEASSKVAWCRERKHGRTNRAWCCAIGHDICTCHEINSSGTSFAC